MLKEEQRSSIIRSSVHGRYGVFCFPPRLAVHIGALDDRGRAVGGGKGNIGVIVRGIFLRDLQVIVLAPRVKDYINTIIFKRLAYSILKFHQVFNIVAIVNEPTSSSLSSSLLSLPSSFAKLVLKRTFQSLRTTNEAWNWGTVGVLLVCGFMK